MSVDIFKNNTRKIPKDDPQIVRVDFDNTDIGGRKSSIPKDERSKDMSIVHVNRTGG